MQTPRRQEPLTPAALCAGHAGGTTRTVWGTGADITVLGQATSSSVACQVRRIDERILSSRSLKVHSCIVSADSIVDAVDVNCFVRLRAG